SNGTPKPLLVHALNGLLPDEIVHRPKQGFTLPFDVWMRGALRPLCEAHLGPGTITAATVARGDRVQQLWQSFLGGGRDVSWSRLWILIVLDVWLDRHQVTM